MVTAQLALETARAWEPPRPTDLDQAAVLRALEDGRRHSRSELVAETLLNDRTLRAVIAELRLAGWPVCSASDRRGYVLSWRYEDLEALERDLSARALSVLRARSAVRRTRQRRVCQ